MSSYNLEKEILKQQKREANIERLGLILAIVTTTAVIWLCFVLAIMGIMMLKSNPPANPPAKTSIDNLFPVAYNGIHAYSHMS